MRDFLLVTNSVKEEGIEYSKKLIEILERKGCRCTANLFTKEHHGGGYLFTDPGLVPAETDAVLVLGGDGTFIHAAKDLISLDLPIMGINFGTLGYLTEVKADEFEDALDIILNNEHYIEKRMLLAGDIIRDREVIHSDIALNDIVLNRSLSTGVINYDVVVNADLLYSYSADGIIISTPTGSTGYNLSAGGPVVQPTAEIILATPIAAHTLNSRSIAFSADVEINLIVKKRFTEREQRRVVSFDGEREIILEDGDIIRIRKADRVTKVIKVNKMSFVEQLGKKMR
ncbi:MAG: NAD(+)/NADH kinase [Lachnospiraceae bacterium]|nr:NAD(+)/NADH kinase [Lachnospiraceae bacterium]